MPDNTRTQIKTRFGQIMEGVTGKALQRAGYTYNFDWQYQTGSIKLDFSTPEGQPSHILEVTQTEARNIIQRKLLRYFELVAEAKVHFDNPEAAIISLIYGTPTEDLPASNLKASLSFFDAAFMPRVDNILTDADKALLANLEAEALRLAEQRTPREQAVAELNATHSAAIEVLARYFREEMPQIRANSVLSQMWQLERERIRMAEISENLRPIETYYKRGILDALFLTEEQFENLLLHSRDSETGELCFHPEFLNLPNDLLSRLIKLGLAEVRPGVATQEIHLSKELKSVLQSRQALEMVRLARRALNNHPKIRWFFEDVHDDDRRIQMAEKYLEVSTDLLLLQEALSYNLCNDQCLNIDHSRCWIADLLYLQVNKAQNFLNNAIVQHPNYTGNLANPFNNIVTKSERLPSNHDELEEYAAISVEIYSNLTNELNTAGELADALLVSRLDGAMYLQNFNPLYLVIESSLEENSWSYEYTGIPSILGDLTNNPEVGRFKVYLAKKGNCTVILNALQITDAHKPNEWAGRGRAMRYRIQKDATGLDQVVNQLSDARFIFVLDGKLTVRMRRRLENAGWQTCTVDELPRVLQELSSDPPTATLNSAVE